VGVFSEHSVHNKYSSYSDDITPRTTLTYT